MSTVIKLYPDLSEMGGIGSYNFESNIIAGEKEVKTPHCIIYTAEANKAIKDGLTQRGWVNYRVALNWHYSHDGDRVMRLWYKRFDNGKNDMAVPEVYAQHRSYPSVKSAYFGCGAGYIEGKPNLRYYTEPNFKHADKYLMLFRVPKATIMGLNGIRQARAIGWKPVFQSDLAMYFINGFHPDKWKGAEWERQYWLQKTGYSCKYINHRYDNYNPEEA